MTNINKFKETLNLCNGVQNNKDVAGWNTLHEFDNLSQNKDFDAKVYKLRNITRMGILNLLVSNKEKFL